MPIRDEDKTILRELAAEQARIAALPIQKHNAGQWRRLNQLGPGKPLVWVNEICWNELAADEELTCRIAEQPWRGVEGGIRRRLYQWKHLPGDMVVEDRLYSPLAIRDTGSGISEDVEIVRTDPTSGIVSRDFHPQIETEADLVKIKTPRVTHDAEASERRYQEMLDIFGDILAVEKRGIAGQWFAPWDWLIRWWDVEKAMIDLVDKPDLVHAAMDRLVTAALAQLDQYEQLNVLSLNNGNVRVGSGGPGFSDELPQADADPDHLRPADLWGCATAQIFSDVSPAMHEEFALQYERRWLERFGLTYYGCCEPLHLKLDILKSVKNLRKVSMSPWADVDKAAPVMAGRYVFSHKPSPAVLAVDRWDPDQARRNLREVLEKTSGCVVEVILKDISTVRYEPHRLWEWTRICAEETEKFA